MTIEELRDLLAKATPGRWVETGTEIYVPGGDGHIVQDRGMDATNAVLMVAAVNALPALLDVAEAVAKCHQYLYEVDAHGRYNAIEFWRAFGDATTAVKRLGMVPNVIGDEK